MPKTKATIPIAVAAVDQADAGVLETNGHHRHELTQLADTTEASMSLCFFCTIIGRPGSTAYAARRAAMGSLLGARRMLLLQPVDPPGRGAGGPIDGFASGCKLARFVGDWESLLTTPRLYEHPSGGSMPKQRSHDRRSRGANTGPPRARGYGAE
jgi:hypothetical protein